MDAQQFAARQAELWRKGLAEWDQAPERIARLRAAAEFAVYTPGSTRRAPREHARLASPRRRPRSARIAIFLRERVPARPPRLLALVGIEADPVQSREHILLVDIL